ncbi:hypothetical protein PENARI_c022G03224 [Penicillium arizonense]|uniref:Uncharacterized protein n=1 Tax=Penicillium arizonense TaxID=1835702 RepID=A0A1F5L7S4_PENAI|nr:hypothetical protein PENARI_c022G03224 [Penicillium arizonense]
MDTLVESVINGDDFGGASLIFGSS